jgi:hypothetical protein
MTDILHSIAVAFVAMFPMINPIGHAPMFYGMTSDDTPARRRVMSGMIGLYVFSLPSHSEQKNDYPAWMILISSGSAGPDFLKWFKDF